MVLYEPHTKENDITVLQHSVRPRERLKYMFRPSRIKAQGLVRLDIIAANKKRTALAPGT